jgi:glutamate racemase
VSNNNNITKVCLGKIDEFNLNYIVFMNLWRHVQYLVMTCTKYELFSRNIRPIFPHFRSLYLCVTNLNDKMVEQLQTVIDLQKLLDNFIIKHRNNKLYFQWE